MIAIRQSALPPLTRSLILATGCGLTLASSYVLSQGDGSILAVALIIGLAVAMLFVPVWYGIMISLTVSAFSPLLKYLASYNAVVHLGPQIVVLPVLLHWLSEQFSVKRGEEVRDLPVRAPTLLLVFFAILMMFAPMTTPVLALGGIISYILPIVYFPMIYTECRDPRRLWHFVVLLMALSVLGAALTIVFVLLGPERVARFGPGFAKAALDPSNVFFDSTTGKTLGTMPLQVVGGVIGYMVSIVFGLSVFMAARASLRGALGVSLLMPSLLIMSAALLMSGVRNAASGAVIGILVVALTGRRRAILPTLLAVGVLALALNVLTALGQTGSIARMATLLSPVHALDSASRTGLIGQSFSMALQHPLGLGMGRVGPGAGALASFAGVNITLLGGDNMLYDAVSELGMAGGILFSAIAILFVTRGWVVYRRLTDPVLKSAALGCCGASLALTSTWLAGPTLMGAPGSVDFWCLGGLCFALPFIERATKVDAA